MIKISLVITTLLTVTACTESDDFPSALGTLERDQIEIIADSSEPIVRVLVSEGDSVLAGDVILILDKARATVALNRAKAEEAAAKSTLAEAERGPRQQKISQSRSRLRAADSAVQTILAELDRKLALVDLQLVARSTVDVTTGRYEEALARQAEAQAALDELIEGTRSETVDQARARHAAAVANVENLKITFARSEVIAPVDATVESLPFEIGERPPGGATVVTLLARSPTYARVHVSASIRSQINTHAKASIHIDGYDQPVAGTVRWVSSKAAFTPYFALNQHDRSRLSYLAEIDVVDTEQSLPVGLPVEVTFPGLVND
ncbi:MAG: HlyD family secretion protein [Candidatus Azotimanducaceae bacterium]|jgi:HlyD family secretion protein